MKYLSLIILLGIIMFFANSYFNIIPDTEDELHGEISGNVIDVQDVPFISDLADVQIIAASFLPPQISFSGNNLSASGVSDAGIHNPKDVLSYIKEQCYTTGVDFNFAVSLLQEENSSFFKLLEGLSHHELAYEARGNNDYGSVCYGLWQLNGNSLWENYLPNFWHNLTEFDWKNPFHNTYVAIRYIKSLYTSLQHLHTEIGIPQLANSIYWETAMAYNSGLDNIQSRSFSNGTLDYAARIFERVKY